MPHYDLTSLTIADLVLIGWAVHTENLWPIILVADRYCDGAIGRLPAHMLEVAVKEFSAALQAHLAAPQATPAELPAIDVLLRRVFPKGVDL